jgi:TrmH family RNA methyltransferase
LIKSLQNKKGRAETGFFIAEGIKEVRELISSGIVIDMIVIDKNFDSSQIELKPYIELYEHNIESVTAMASSEGILAVARTPEPVKADLFFKNKSNILGLFSINDPGNIGTIIRTARWFGTDGIILYGDCADVYSPKVLRSSMGAVFGTDFIKFNNFGDSSGYIKDFHKISTYLHKENNYPKDNRSKKILFLGNEANGIDRTLEHVFESNFRIGSDGGFESLNVSVAAGIIMHEIFKSQRGK